MYGYGQTDFKLAACFHGKVWSTTRQTHFYRLMPKKIPVFALHNKKRICKYVYARDKYLALSVVPN